VRPEITDLDALRAHRAAGKDLRGALLVALDLTEHDEELRTALDGAVLLGCRLSSKARTQAEAAGALVFPAIDGLPYRSYRSHLYTPDELFAGFDPARPQSYADTPDARIYAYTLGEGNRPDPLHALAERLHDHSITTALDELLERNPNPVAVMGGHALARDSAGYRQCARLGQQLGPEFTVLTGGGPGAMEAVPLGARLPGADLSDVLAGPASVPRFDSGAHGKIDPTAIGRWLAAAQAVPLPAPADPPRTIGIPTWFYGHEPPNLACEVHAKYFANSVREDGLLTVATGGVVYTPGSAGTVQEIFADYTQNHYGSVGPPAPMVFLGTEFWTSEIPAAPLVQHLARGREAEKWILVTDDVDEAVDLLQRYAAQHQVG
jgi:predicted Rossmann-fold nucleotide-binding protein